MSAETPDPRIEVMTDRELLATCVQAQRYTGVIGRVANNPQDFAIADRIIAQGFARSGELSRLRRQHAAALARSNRAAPKEWAARNRYRDGWDDAMTAVRAALESES